MYNLKNLVKEHEPKNNSFYLVAIDGRGGSGKTTFLEYIKTILPGFIFLNGDDYFEPANDGIAWGQFNDDRFKKEVINELREARKEFMYRPFDWHNEPHISEREIVVNQGLVLERGYSFNFELKWDLKIWVETPREVCFARGVSRDHMERGKEVVAWQAWQAKEDEYIEQFQPRDLADIIIDGTLPFSEQLQ